MSLFNFLFDYVVLCFVNCIFQYICLFILVLIQLILYFCVSFICLSLLSVWLTWFPSLLTVSFIYMSPFSDRSCWKLLILEAAVTCSAWSNGIFVFLLLITAPLSFRPDVWFALSYPSLILSFSFSVSCFSGIWWICACCILISTFNFSNSFFSSDWLITSCHFLIMFFNFPFSLSFWCLIYPIFCFSDFVFQLFCLFFFWIFNLLCLVFFQIFLSFFLSFFLLFDYCLSCSGFVFQFSFSFGVWLFALDFLFFSFSFASTVFSKSLVFCFYEFAVTIYIVSVS